MYKIIDARPGGDGAGAATVKYRHTDPKEKDADFQRHELC